MLIANQSEVKPTFRGTEAINSTAEELEQWRKNDIIMQYERERFSVKYLIYQRIN